MSHPTPIDDLIALCRAHDYERYLCSLFAPKTHRIALWSILALGYEWSRIPATVQEDMIALVKLKWWQEQCHNVTDETASLASLPPLLVPLVPSLQRSPQLIHAMDAMLDALATYSSEGATLETVCDTMRALYRMCAHTLEQSASEEAYSTLGYAYGIIAFMRSTRNHENIATMLPILDTACVAMIRPRDSFGTRLYRLNHLWQRRIHRAARRSSYESLQMIPLLALRLL